MSAGAMKPIGFLFLLLMFLYGAAVHAGEQKCSAARLRANLTKSDGKWWLVEEDPLPPQKRITVGTEYPACVAHCENPFQPIRRLSIDRDKTWVAVFGADYMPARLRVAGKELSLDRIAFMLPLPAMWQSVIIQRYAKPGVRFTLSAPDGACGAGTLVLTIDGRAAAEPFPTERWQFKRPNTNW
ncbi:hypothetical protein ABH994_002319 [Bradyrhizobium yuanmingense]|uniref:hypothetical protein n=1 Tax=Bradyrhizobium yuanmingense TaxID=108015 RepID=UPI00351420C9